MRKPPALRSDILTGMLHRVRFLLPAVLALAAFAAACGGDQDDAGPTASPANSTPSAATVPPGATAVSLTGPDGGLTLCLPPDKAPLSKDFPPSVDPAKSIPEDQRNKVNVVVAGLDFYVGDNNFVFGITNKQDQPEGKAKARVTFYDISEPKTPKAVCQAEAVESAPGVGTQVQHIHATGDVHTHGGEDDNRVGYFVRARFGYAGAWGVAVEAVLQDGTRGVANVGFQVTAKSAIPAAGEAAPKSDNLTKKDVEKISEIDSGDPPNDMHDVKIKDAIAAGRPVVVVFSTPAYCTSRFCGPVNEEVESLMDVYKDRVDFVHIEIWRDRVKQVLNPTAQEWLIRQDGNLIEPYVYVVDKTGIIYNRWEGPVARNIMEQSVKDVAEGKTFK